MLIIFINCRYPGLKDFEIQLDAGDYVVQLKNLKSFKTAKLTVEGDFLDEIGLDMWPYDEVNFRCQVQNRDVDTQNLQLPVFVFEEQS